MWQAVISILASVLMNNKNSNIGNALNTAKTISDLFKKDTTSVL